MTATTSPADSPAAGSAAPDLALRDAAGAEVRLSALWAATPETLALVFVRHFG